MQLNTVEAFAQQDELPGLFPVKNAHMQRFRYDSAAVDQFGNGPVRIGRHGIVAERAGVGHHAGIECFGHLPVDQTGIGFLENTKYQFGGG